MNNKFPNSQKKISPVALALLCAVFLIGMVLILVLHNKIEKEEISFDPLHVHPSPAEPSDTPAPTIPPDIVLERDEEAWKLNTPDTEEVQYVYDNSAKLSCDLASTIHLTIGIGNSFKSSGIYLEPTLTYDYETDPNEAYVFIIRASNGSIEYPGEPSTRQPDKRFYYVAGRTYDKLICSDFDYENIDGLKWRIDAWNGDAPEVGANLTIHAVRLDDGFLMGSAKASIIYDATESVYKLSTLARADVASTGELSAEEREEMVRDAVAFINAGNDIFPLEITEIEFLNYQEFIVVEHLDRVLHSRLFDKDGNVAPAGRFLKYTVYAVSVPDTGHGYITVYFAPITEIKGYSSAEEQKGFCVLGYDAWMASDVDTFNSYLFPEDAAEFGVS